MFDSNVFILSLPIIFFLYYLLPVSLRNYVLLISSILIVFQFGVVSVVVCVGVTLIVFFIAVLIEKAISKVLLLYSAISLIIAGFVLIRLQVGDSGLFLYATGYSYYSFQCISYLVEVYYGRYSVEKNLMRFFLYIFFFPKFASGPIEKPKFLRQLESNNKPFNYTLMMSGLKLMLLGYFKKLVIANRLELVTGNIFSNIKEASSLDLLLALILYSIEIYADFSAYADLAVGTGMIFGLNLARNFDKPYLSRSITEFWRKWHITLSQWARDYVYLPLAYKTISSFKRLKLSLNTKEHIAYVSSSLLTMIVIGLWHGFTFGFLVWGILHGFYLSIGRLTKSLRRRYQLPLKKTLIYKIGAVICTFLLVTFSWVFFRFNDFYSAITVLEKIVLLFTGQLFSVAHLLKFNAGFYIIMLFVLLLLFSEIFESQIKQYFYNLPLMLRWMGYAIFIIFILTFGVFEGNTFIYIKF
ncbi:MAG: MBOAT family O-acyltransferase [Ignavibacteria bacterium]